MDRVSKVNQILASRYKVTVMCSKQCIEPMHWISRDTRLTPCDILVTPQFQQHTHVLLQILNRHSDRHAPWIAKERHLRSKIRWFTEFCNSHYLSHLAAFFIDPRAKRSTVRSCLYFFISVQFKHNPIHIEREWIRSSLFQLRKKITQVVEEKIKQKVHVGPRKWHIA